MLPKLVVIGTVVVQMFLVCHIIWQDHVTKGKRLLKVSQHPPKLGSHRHCGSGGSGDMVLVWHVILT